MPDVPLAERPREAVAALVSAGDHVAQVEQDLVEGRVEVAHHRPLHGLEHLGVNVGRPGPTQQAGGRREFGNRICHPVVIP